MKYIGLLKGSHLLWQEEKAGILHLVTLPHFLQVPLLPVQPLPGLQEPEGLQYSCLSLWDLELPFYGHICIFHSHVIALANFSSIPM